MAERRFASFLDRLGRRGDDDATPVAHDPDTLLSPVRGAVIPIEEIGDPAFSEGIVGLGAGIVPAEGRVVSPVEGTVAHVATSGHALSIRSSTRREVLLHIGIDTVALGGAGFAPRVTAGDRVGRGDLLVSFDLEALTAAGFDPTIALLVTDHPRDFRVELLTLGTTAALAPVFRILPDEVTSTP